MKSILDHYCRKDNGLLLFNPPTGLGKTHAVLEWIFEHYKDYCKGERKIFFVTNLKKNLPFEQLRDDFFKPNNREADFEKDFLFIDANSEQLVKNFEAIKHKINPYFKKDDTYRNIATTVKFIRKAKNDASTRDLIDVAKRELRSNLEPEFRRKITQYLKDRYTSPKARLRAIRDIEELNWIGTLYPTVYTSEKKVFFLSIDKFYTKNSTLIEPSYSFLSNPITKKALIFLDEFDATKEPILNQIIETGKRRRIDFLHLFNEIYWALSKNEFPSGLLQVSPQSFYKDFDKLIPTLTQKAEEIVNEYRLECNFKTTGERKDRKRNLLFHDFRYHAVYRNNAHFIQLRHDAEASVNAISFVENRPEESEDRIVHLFNRIRGYLVYFQSVIRTLASNYKEIKQQDISDRNAADFTFDMALSTVLEEFRLDAKSKDYLTDAILIEREATIANSKNPARLYFDTSIYENGFRYYDFVDDYQHETMTKIYLYNFQSTPEKFMLRLAEKAMVIGISATAQIRTVTGNYDIPYLKRQLGSSFYELTQIERDQLRQLFDERIASYKDIRINCDWLVPEMTNVDDEWLQCMQDEEITQELIASMNPKTGENFYVKRRHLKIVKAFSVFLLEPELYGFLCLLNKEPKRRDPALDLDILEKAFDHLIRLHKKEDQFLDKDGEYKVGSAYQIVNSLDFDTKKQDFLHKLHQGKKVFVVSMYQTMGAGQNLQFSTPPDREFIVLDKNRPVHGESKTDFSGIYLEKPSHLIQKIDDQLTEEGFIRYLFQLEFLQDSGRISMKQLNEQVTKAFRLLIAEKSETVNAGNQFLYKDENIRQHYAKFIIQAIGRLCRTRFKAPVIHILADADLKEAITQFDANETLLLPEFEQLLQSAENTSSELPDNNPLSNRALVTDQRAKARLSKYLRWERNWTFAEQQEWKSLRNMCLMFPTLTLEESRKKGRVLDMYIELPEEADRLYYRSELAGGLQEVLFFGTSPQVISAADVQLERLLSVPEVAEHFTKKGYAQTFRKAKYILCPTLYRSIYKAALGEEVGSLLLSKLGIKLEEMPLEHFELFDFRIQGTDNYVDFKYWLAPYEEDLEKAHEKILQKLAKVGGAKVFLINLFSDNNAPVICENGRIIKIPGLLNKNNEIPPDIYTLFPQFE